VFQQQGDWRAAVNLTLEWCGLLGAWCVLSRQCVAGRGAALVLELVAAIAVGQACLGVAQHHVIYAENAEWYRERREILDGWSSDAAGCVVESVVVAVVFRMRRCRRFWRSFVSCNSAVGFRAGVVGVGVLYSQEPIGTLPRQYSCGPLTGWSLILAVCRAAGRGCWCGWGAGLVVTAVCAGGADCAVWLLSGADEESFGVAGLWLVV
jgi:hypothetical protein